MSEKTLTQQAAEVWAELGPKTNSADVKAEVLRRNPKVADVSAGTLTAGKKAAFGNGNGQVGQRILSYQEGKRLEAIAEEHGGMEKFTATITMLDQVAGQFGGFEGLKAALKEVQGEE